MENNTNLETTINQNRSSSQPSSGLPMLLIGALVGALAGGVSGYQVASRTVSSDGTVKPSQVNSTLSVQEESETVKVVEKSAPAVVTVIATKELSQIQNQRFPFDDFFGFPSTQPNPAPSGKQEVGQGAGFIVEPDGLIVTNKHVVKDTGAEYSVVLQDGRTFDAKVLALDPSNDIAVIKIDAKDLPVLEFGDSSKVDIGQTVIAIGNPLKFRGSVTKGIISGVSRTITAQDGSGRSETLEDVFQTDAAINPGNSGGPLINLAGQVIAMNTAVSQEGQLLGFAIPSNVIKSDVQSVKDRGKIVKPYLGIRYVLITESFATRNDLPVKEGALLQKGDNNDPAVIPGSPADKAGLLENDIILEVNGEKITETRSLIGLLGKYKPEDKIDLKVYRKGDTINQSVTLGERSE